MEKLLFSFFSFSTPLITRFSTDTVVFPDIILQGHHEYQVVTNDFFEPVLAGNKNPFGGTSFAFV